MLDFWEKHMIPCPFKLLTGHDCPGCGMQRALIELLKGDIKSSFLHYPALIPIIIMFGFLFLHLKFNFKHGAQILKYLFILNAIMISVNYLYKLFF
ncbi:MAG TPA: DUF2752 domain-containing protein [Bacteroidales bacterium]|nr:DUF2752 domain-containing protein [Bacteroidales bacterium]